MPNDASRTVGGGRRANGGDEDSLFDVIQAAPGISKHWAIPRGSSPGGAPIGTSINEIFTGFALETAVLVSVPERIEDLASRA